KIEHVQRYHHIVEDMVVHDAGIAALIPGCTDLGASAVAVEQFDRGLAGANAQVQRAEEESSLTEDAHGGTKVTRGLIEGGRRVRHCVPSAKPLALPSGDP